jgi:hypothetical protein
MRIQMLRKTIVDLQQVEVGDIVETDHKSALLLIGIKKAIPAPTTQEVVVTVEPELQVETESIPAKPASKRRKTNDSQPRV